MQRPNPLSRLPHRPRRKSRDAGNATGRLEPGRPQTPADPARQGCRPDQQRIGQPQPDQAEEGGHSDRQQRRLMQGAPAQPPGGLQHDRQHRRFQGPEQRHQQRQLTPEGIEAGQPQQQQHRGQQEQPAGDQATGNAMHQPAQIGGQLGGLRPRQQHAVVEGMQKATLGEPLAPLHQLAVQQSDLPRRPTEAHQPQLQPEAGGVGQGRGDIGHGGSGHGGRRLGAVGWPQGLTDRQHPRPPLHIGWWFKPHGRQSGLVRTGASLRLSRAHEAIAAAEQPGTDPAARRRPAVVSPGCRRSPGDRRPGRRAHRRRGSGSAAADALAAAPASCSDPAGSTASFRQCALPAIGEQSRSSLSRVDSAVAVQRHGAEPLLS